LGDVSRNHLEDVDRRLRGALTAFFRRRLPDAAEAEDMTQEVFIRLARSAKADGDAPDSYVFAIAANLLRDRARREKVRADYRDAKRLEDYVGIDPLDPFRIAAGRQDLSKLTLAIANLPEKTRRIFTLYRIENIDKQRLAETFGLSVRMIEIHIQRALVAVYADMEAGA
jgi:RNA polymerase sigma factor (sigma-70 family)